MFNSFELLQGSIDAIQKKYETLSDIVTEYGGKVHVAKETEIQRLASSTWYIMKFHQESDEVKKKFKNFARNNIILQQY